MVPKAWPSIHWPFVHIHIHPPMCGCCFARCCQPHCEQFMGSVPCLRTFELVNCLNCQFFNHQFAAPSINWATAASKIFVLVKIVSEQLVELVSCHLVSPFSKEAQQLWDVYLTLLWPLSWPFNYFLMLRCLLPNTFDNSELFSPGGGALVFWSLM